jgi:hypothetical protein
MRTTLNLDDDLIAEVRAMALRRRATLSQLVEEGLRILVSTTRPPEGFMLPVGDGRLAPEVDLSSPEATAAWLRRVDEDS